MILHEWKENDAPLLIIMGQSNAHGHGTKLTPEESSLVCSNVFGLAREENQSYQCKEVIWNPFRMQGMNLGETQDNTCCLGSEFARLWENKSNQGAKLPPLRIVQISIGSQGIDAEEKDGLNMWWPKRPEVMIPGTLENVNISLYPLAIHILSLVKKDLSARKLNPVIVGLHWNQWETEVFSGGAVMDRAEENYTNLFQGFYEVLGERCRTYLYRPISLVYENEPARKQLTTLFQQFENKYDNVRLIDPTKSPLFRYGRNDKGIFQEDLVHYTAETQKWFAEFAWEDLFGRRILVLGDSITADGRYIEYLNEYFDQYRPKEKITFINGGLCSENVSGLTETIHPGPRPCILERVEEVLKQQDCQKVLICYGMNDGIYHPFREDYFEKYKKGMASLIMQMEKWGMEVCLMTPPPFDSLSFEGELRSCDSDDFSYLFPYKEYDKVLEIYSKWLLEEYGEKGYVVIDLHSKLKELNYSSGDGIHPGEEGHCLIMAVVLEGLFQTTLTWLCEGKTDHETEWEGFLMDCFCWKGYEVSVAKPKKAVHHKGWIYRTEFFGAFPTADIEMLSKGYYVANLKICNHYGDIIAVNLMEEFRQMIVKRYEVNEKPILFGFSRGGLYALHYIGNYGENVDKVYLDAPVIDIYSWPRGYEDGHSIEWQQCRKCFRIEEDQTEYFKVMEQEIYRMTELKIPLVLVYGDADEVVPYPENGYLVEQRYEKSKVPYVVIKKSGCGHHPHSLENPTQIVEFLNQ